jgi:hypothetical protein
MVVTVVLQVSAPYSNIGFTMVLKSLILVVMLISLDPQFEGTSRVKVSCCEYNIPSEEWSSLSYAWMTKSCFNVFSQQEQKPCAALNKTVLAQSAMPYKAKP